jgi:uncharacterized protein (TIGR03437 family)
MSKNNQYKTGAPLAVLLGLGLSISTAAAQSPGTFVATGNMTAVRMGHTATLLKDGRVLITGGSGLATAELYDPSAGAFLPTGSMAAARLAHTATLLSDGRVLIAGGSLAGTPSAELYDPATGTFAPTGTMLTPAQHGHTATPLGNGKVLISRGTIVGPGGFLQPALPELYDPATGLFASAGGASGTQEFSTATLLPDGKVVLAGGWNKGDVSLYDPASGSLTVLANFLVWTHSSTLLANGSVLIAGGVFFSSSDAYNDYGVDSLATAQLYDPSRGIFRMTGSFIQARDRHTATLLPGGLVLVAGGDWNYVRTLSSAELYDSAAGGFAGTGEMNFKRMNHTATLLPDGRVLIVGGTSETTSAEVYIPPIRAVSSATLTESVAPESLGSVFGSTLALITESADPLSPPTSLGGISLRLHDSAGATSLVPLLYVSPTQINFQVPARTAVGTATLEIVNSSSVTPKATVQVNTAAPGLFAYEDNTAVAYALRYEPDGKKTVLSVRDTIVLDDRPVYLVAYATGIRNRSSIANVQGTIGGIPVPVEYAGPEGSGAPALDQANIRLTSALNGLGIANLVLTVDGVASNAVSVDIR